jgi:DNA-binding NarL/FixJ family response regulator
LALVTIAAPAVVSTFLVHRSASMGPPALPHTSQLQSPTLILDDDPAQGATTLATLVAGGFPAVAESKGDAALRHARSSLTRLMVSELYVPCAEGKCVVAVLKGDRARLPRLQILVHTRHSTAVDTDWALEAGCDALVPKSASAVVLVRELRRLDGFAA